MKHKSLIVTASALALVGLSTPAIAAELSNAEGQTCEGIGVWHFVNNQTNGAAPGTLTATFTDGTVWVEEPSKVTRSTQHFIVEASGTLLDASTNLPGRLVLSDYSCDDDGGEKK